MKIAFLNRGRDAMLGGDLVALDATMAALRRQGVECVETGWDVEAMKSGGFDLAHMMHVNFSWSWGNYEAIKKAGLKYVLTPVYYPNLLSGIDKDQLKVIVQDASAVIPFSHKEAMELADAVYGYFFQPAIIPNGTDPRFHNTSDAMNRTGVLCVSARDANDKNIPKVRAICEELNLPFECVTGVPHDEMHEVYKRFRVFISATESDRMSLTVGEALCAGCRVVSSHGNRGNESYPGLVVDNIHRDVVARAYNLPDWNYYPNYAARKLTWDVVAERLIEVYKGVVG